MKNTIYTCDLCERLIVESNGISFDKYDLCNDCIALVRRAMCTFCLGTGKMQVRDNEATDAQATCGESRTQYKTISCSHCTPK